MRLGDLDALKENLKQYFSDGVLDSVSAKIAFNMILRKIDEAPTVEIPNYGGQVVPDTLQGWKYEERPQGKWIYTPNIIGLSEYEGITCSICGDDSVGDFNFCPNCGARMQKGGAE